MRPGVADEVLLPIPGPGPLTAPDGRRFVAFAVDGGYRVADAACPHNGGPLEQGWTVEGATVVCPWHWYRFDLRTGYCATSPQHVLGVYPVVDVEGAPHADVGVAAAPSSWSERLRAHARTGNVDPGPGTD